MTEREIREYLESSIASFDNDPPDSAFQRGYLAALHSVLEDCFIEERRARRAALRRKGS